MPFKGQILCSFLALITSMDILIQMRAYRKLMILISSIGFEELVLDIDVVDDVSTYKDHEFKAVLTPSQVNTFILLNLLEKAQPRIAIDDIRLKFCRKISFHVQFSCIISY